MNIEHIAVYVNDLESERDFFEKYFGGHSGSLYINQKTQFMSYFISFDNGARLELMTRPDLHDNAEKSDRAGYAHIAFAVGSKEKVDSLTKRMRSDGFSIISGPGTTGDGYYESCIEDTEGNRIEITI